MFRGKYLKNLPPDFSWQSNPLQMYPLSSMSDYFVLPTPLLKTDYNFLIYIRDGIFTQQLGTEKVRVEAPALLYSSSGTISSLESIEKPMKGYFILIEDKTMSAILKKNVSLELFTIFPVLRIDDTENAWIYSLCKLLYAEVKKNKASPEICHGLLEALLHKVLALSSGKRSLNRVQQIAMSFKQLVYANFKEQKGIVFYAQRLNVSENYLNRCVSTIFHKNAKQIILEIAILHSQLLMWDVSIPISQVCFDINFEDPSYFSRLFKKITGMSPREYRSGIMHDLC